MRFGLCFLLILLSQLLAAQEVHAPDELVRARFIYRRLSHQVLIPGSADETFMLAKISAGRLDEAAAYAQSKTTFVSSLVRAWATELLTNQKGAQLELNDALATLMGSVRDDLDARLLLTGNYVYGPDARFGLGLPRPESNSIYSNLDEQGKSLSLILQRYSPQWDSSVQAIESAGLLTSRYWASINYQAGTNRRVIPAVMESFLCQTIENWRRPNLPTTFIRRDIDRFPQGDARLFQTSCRTCHSVMDGLSGAFSKIDFANNKISWLAEIAPKFLQNETIYPDGKITTDQSFVNYLMADPAQVYGWKTPATGQGIREFGNMIAQADLFPKCLAKRAIGAVCQKDLAVSDAFVVRVSQKFKTDAYRLKSLFANAAIDPSCR